MIMPDRETIERYMGDPERCMPSERAALERMGYKAMERVYPNGAIPTNHPECRG